MLGSQAIVYPWTRHYQRYEYVIQRGWIKNKTVLDIGCGFPIGSLAMTISAKAVMAIDPIVIKDKPYFVSVPKPIVGGVIDANKLIMDKTDIYNVVGSYDVGVAIEVIEHIEDNIKFIEKVANLCKYAFFTTPLVEENTKTRNKSHHFEYTRNRLHNVLSKRFEILEEKYQSAQLQIVDTLSPSGDSLDPFHVVQMVWCRRK